MSAGMNELLKTSCMAAGFTQLRCDLFCDWELHAVFPWKSHENMTYR